MFAQRGQALDDPGGQETPASDPQTPTTFVVTSSSLSTSALTPRACPSQIFAELVGAHLTFAHCRSFAIDRRLEEIATGSANIYA